MDSILSSLNHVRSALSGQTTSSATSRSNLLANTSKYSLTNKKECVQCILGFLASRDFHPCSAKDLLRSPPLQILLDIWNFLFKMVDAKANITKENMAAEVPKFFKEFGYPHIMKTSHLRTPTADHQWESNLVALSWLCKLLLYEQECFGKSFEGKSTQQGQGPFGLDIAGRGKSTVSNSRVAQFVTEQATKHYQLYLQGEENSMQLMEDFDTTIGELLGTLQMNIDTKADTLENLRVKTLDLQEELESFARTKEWIKTANVELQRIDAITAALNSACIEAEEHLKNYKQLLKSEQTGLAEQEERNKDLETIIERQGGNSQALRDVNQTIKVLKGQITEDNRKIKELEHDISTTEANIHTIEGQLVRAQNALASSHESIKNFLINNGRDADSWKNVESLNVNVTGDQESEILGVCPSAYARVLDEIIHKDRDQMQLSQEARIELEDAHHELENLGNTLTRETSETLREVSALFKTHILEDKESALQIETNNLADVIRTAAREELDRAKSELETVETALAEANKRLRQQEQRAQAAWHEIMDRLKELFKMARENKESNCTELRRLIHLEKSLAQGQSTATHDT